MKREAFLGLDIGSSSIKASIIDAEKGELIASASSPETELRIDSPHSGWAEQHPDTWWDHVKLAVNKIMLPYKDRYFVSGIGISYQMHGLVLVDKNHNVLRPGIIWCDSRAVDIGNKAFKELGSEYCLGSCLNSPGNFTASKLKWVKDNEPELYNRIFKIMLPGDFIAMKLTNKINTTVSGLSEGVFWDFREKGIAQNLLDYYGIDKNLLPDIVPVFGEQGRLSSSAARDLGVEAGIPVSYRSGDQPNNALSLNVLNPGEAAATAGTSGVIYGVSDKILFDEQSRVNTFAHVNYSEASPNVGVLLCINGTGIQYSWLKQNILENKYSYYELNNNAQSIAIGAEGLYCYPFGNGSERIFGNANIGGNYSGLNFNIHTKDHLVRAAQEGIVFTFRYGLEIMRSMGMDFNIVRAGNTNLFQSRLFREAFVNTCGVNLELYSTDGSQGAARGAGIGTGYYKSFAEAFSGLKLIEHLAAENELSLKYNEVYDKWVKGLHRLLNAG